VDVTPRWARLLSRPFGALAFAGFTACCAWLVVLLARPAPRSSIAALVCLAAVVQIGWQSLFHVEPRYGLGTIPLALLVLVVRVERARTGVDRRSRLLILVGLLAAAGAFLWQTHRWDVSDGVLQQIERSQPASSARAITLSSRIGFTPSKIGSTSASTTFREMENSSA